MYPMLVTSVGIIGPPTGTKPRWLTCHGATRSVASAPPAVVALEPGVVVSYERNR